MYLLSEIFIVEIYVDFQGSKLPILGEVSRIMHCLAWCRLVIYLYNKLPIYLEMDLY